MAQWQELRERGSEAFNTMTAAAAPGGARPQPHLWVQRRHFGPSLSDIPLIYGHRGEGGRGAIIPSSGEKCWGMDLFFMQFSLFNIK